MTEREVLAGKENDELKFKVPVMKLSSWPVRGRGGWDKFLATVASKGLILELSDSLKLELGSKYGRPRSMIDGLKMMTTHNGKMGLNFDNALRSLVVAPEKNKHLKKSVYVPLIKKAINVLPENYTKWSVFLRDI